MLAGVTRKRSCIIVGCNSGYISFITWRIYINYAREDAHREKYCIMMINSIDTIFLLQWGSPRWANYLPSGNCNQANSYGFMQ